MRCGVKRTNIYYILLLTSLKHVFVSYLSMLRDINNNHDHRVNTFNNYL